MSAATKETVKVATTEMESRAKRSAVALGPPVSVTLDPSPTVRLSRSDINALLERKPRRSGRWFVLGVAVAFVGGAWVGTIKVREPAPVLPRPAPVVVEAVRLVAPSPETSAPPERKLQRLTRVRAKSTVTTSSLVDTKTPLFSERAQ